MFNNWINYVFVNLVIRGYAVLHSNLRLLSSGFVFTIFKSESKPRFFHKRTLGRHKYRSGGTAFTVAPVKTFYWQNRRISNSHFASTIGGSIKYEMV